MLIDHLHKTFSERARKNPRYSLRAFAQSLDIDSSTLSALMRGKRPLTPKTAKHLIRHLDVGNEFEAERILLETIGPVVSKEESYSDLDLEHFEMIGSWEHFAILALLEVRDFEATERHISLRLNIPFGVVGESLARLEKLSLVEKNGNSWKLTRKNIATPSNVPNKALRKANREYIEKALVSLEEDSVDLRDITGITMAIDSNKLPEAKNLIKEFRRKLASFLESGKQNEVYRVNIQLFPLSKRGQA